MGPHIAVVPTSEVKAGPLSREALYQVTMYREELYICRPPEGLWVPLLVQQVEVDDRMPLEEEIELAVRGMKGRRVRGGHQACTRNLRGGWLQEANCKKGPLRR